MKITIPQNTQEIIARATNDGDLSEISRMIYGDNSRRRLVQVAIQNGFGNAKVVKAIVKFYGKKEKLITQLA